MNYLKKKLVQNLYTLDIAAMQALYIITACTE